MERLDPNILRFPDFYVIGFMKCASTTLDQYMVEHPQIHMGQKDKHRLARLICGQPVSHKNRTDIEEYFKHMDCFDQSKLVGENSIWYIFYKKRLAHFIEYVSNNPKYIVIMRDPVERFESHYNFITNEKLSIDEVLDACLRGDVRNEDHKNGDILYEYIEQGMYYKYISRWLDYVGGDISRFHFVEFKELTENTEETLSRLWEFLGVDQIKMNYDKWFVKNRHKRAFMNPNLKKRLVDIYREDVQNLHKLTGLNLDHWLK